MTDNNELIIEAFDARAQRREDRREFFKTMGGATAALAGAVALGTGTGARAQAAAPTDADILNFCLLYTSPSPRDS